MTKTCPYGAKTSRGRESQKKPKREMLGIDNCYEKLKPVIGSESKGSGRGLVFIWMAGEASQNRPHLSRGLNGVVL